MPRFIPRRSLDIVRRLGRQFVRSRSTASAVAVHARRLHRTSTAVRSHPRHLFDAAQTTAPFSTTPREANSVAVNVEELVSKLDEHGCSAVLDIHNCLAMHGVGGTAVVVPYRRFLTAIQFQSYAQHLSNEDIAQQVRKLYQ